MFMFNSLLKKLFEKVKLHKISITFLSFLFLIIIFLSICLNWIFFIKIQQKEKSFQYLVNLIEKIGLDIQKNKRVSEKNIEEIAWIVQKTNPDLSISLLQDLLKLNPDNLFLIIQLASIYDSNGYTDKAITLLENVLSRLKKEEVDYQYFVFLGSLYEKRGNIEKAYEWYKKGLENWPVYDLKREKSKWPIISNKQRKQLEKHCRKLKTNNM